ncbi:MAG: choice-of-anchor J domain-containing protein, partial [Endomicrobiaceae bacterium]
FTPSVSGIYYLGFNCYSDENQFNLYIDNVKVFPIPPFEVSPESVDFGTFATGSASSTQNVSFLNNTDSEFNVTAITLVGTNASDFQLVNTPELPYALEAMGANFGSVGVKFNPAATGNKSANLRFTYSSGQTYNVPLTGQAINVSITEPVVEDFEGDVFPPLGWTITGDENNFNWRLMDSEPYAYSGNNSAMVGRDAGDYLLVSPVVNVANNNKTLSFFVRDHTYLETWDKDDEYLEVYISTSGSGINDFTGDPVVSLDSEDLMPLYRRVFVNLEDYVGQSVYVAFKRVATGGNYIYVDNVTFNSDVVPTYDAPTNVTAQLVDNYINVNWQAPVVLRSRFTRTGGYAIVLDSYNLYRNDILIASNLITTDYTDRNPLNGSLNTYTVRARYKEIVNEVETGVIVLSEHSNPFDIAFDVLFPPNSLTAINPDSTRNVILEWDNHSIGERWFTHQQGDTPQNSFGIANETYTAAHRFTPQQLGDLRGATLTKVKFVPGVAQDIYTIKVWVGGSSGPYNPGFLVSEQQVTGVTANQWNEVTLDTPVNIPQNRELWIGYEVTQPGLATARCDAGPRQHGSGNLLKRSSQDNWTTMFNYQPIHSYNWLIQGLAEAPGDEYITFSSSGNRRVSREEFVSEVRSLTGYKVYRGEELLETISANTYTDTNVPDGEHTYYVSAVYDGGESEATPVNIIVEVADAFPATGLTATSDYGRVELMWEAPVPEFNTGRELAGYNIYKQERDVPARSSLRRSDEYAGFEFLVQVEANVTSYVDNDNREREFAYYVTAVYDNPEGESIPSNISAAVPLGYNAPQNIVAETAFDNTTGTYTVDLVWDAPEFDDRLVVNYNIYRNQDLLNETPIADLNFTDEGVVFGNYTYYVTAVYEDYDNAESFPVEVELILDNIIPPVNLTYLVDYYTITLNWQAHSSRAMLSSKRSSRDANNFIGYNVYRNDELLTETPITALTFVEEDMAPDTYIYKITSVYDYTGGESLPIVIEIEVDDIQAVQNLTAEVDDYDVILAWEYPEGYDSFNGLLGFNLYRNEELVNEEALLNVLTYTHDNILNGTYVYSVVAVYRNGEAEAVTVDVTVDYEHIMPPRDLACEQYQDDVILSWIAPGNPAGLRAQLGYNIYRDEVLITEEPVADLTYTDENLVNGEYTYSVSAVYESGESETESVSLNLFYLPEPEDLNVEIPENENTVILTWTAPPAHLEFGDVTGFDIWRKYFGRSRVSWVKINEEPLPVSQLTYTDPEILDGDYLYAVTARYENYDNDEAEPIIFTTVEVNMHFVYVQVPTNVTQTVEQNNVTLYWLPYAGNEEIGSLLGYKIYRNDELLNEDLLNASTFTDSDVPWGTYIYGVRAVYGIYESNIVYLPEIEITYEPTPPAVNLTAMVDDNEVTLNWQAPEHLQNDRAFVGYKVYRNEELLTEELIAETTYLDEEVDYGVHTYAVQAVYNGGESSLLSISVIIDNIQPIVNLDVVVTNYDVTLNWDVPEHLQENRALLNYQIYRGEILLAETTEQEFTDIEVEPGIYTYGVIAVYDNGPAEIVTVETTVYDLVPATNLAYELTEYTLALSWDRAESEFVEAYHIYKNDELLVELTIEDSLYTDTVVEAGIYTYAIKAIYPTGGVLSEAISVEVDYINIVTQLNAIVTNYDVTLNWLAPGNEIRALLGYNIMKDDVLLNEELITENTFTDTELEPGGYIYAVSAVFANGESDYVTLEVIVDDMLPVINLSAVAYEYNVYLNWEINESSAAQGYKIFRDGVSVSDDIIEELNFTDTNVSVGIHEYAVNAVYSNGMSEAVTYEVEIVPHIISIFPYTYGFENDNFPGVDWINTHIGDANGSWRERNNSEYANTGNKSAMVGNTRGDYWLISPPVEVTEDSKTLSFFARDHSNTTTMDKADEYLYVKISTSSQSLIGFETVATLDYRSLQTQYQKYVVDLSDYMNQTIHIAFNRLSTGGNYVYLDDVSFDAQELPVFNAPQNVIAQAGENEITIEWELPTIEEGQQLVAYKLFRNNNLISELNELSYLDNNVVADTEYQYFVKAVYTQGISLASEIATATPYQLLPATQLTAVPGDMQIALTWQAPVMNISRNTISSARSNRDNVLILEGYQVYRNNVAITETVSDADFVDTNVMPGVTYRYYVKAVYNLGVSSASNTVQTVAYQIIAPHTLIATEGLNRITLNWQHGISLVRNNKNELKSNQGQMKFNVYKDGEILASSITSRFYQDNAVVAGEEHTYYVTAVYRQGESQASENVTASAYDLQAPRELIANAGNRQVELVWTAPTYMNDDFFVG